MIIKKAAEGQTLISFHKEIRDKTVFNYYRHGECYVRRGNFSLTNFSIFARVGWK